MSAGFNFFLILIPFPRRCHTAGAVKTSSLKTVGGPGNAVRDKGRVSCDARCFEPYFTGRESKQPHCMRRRSTTAAASCAQPDKVRTKHLCLFWALSQLPRVRDGRSFHQRCRPGRAGRLNSRASPSQNMSLPGQSHMEAPGIHRVDF